MTLLTMSTNVQDGVDLASRKRCHDDFVKEEEESCAPLSAGHVGDGSTSDKENDARCTPAQAAKSPSRSSSVLSEPPSSPAPPSTHSASAAPATSSTMPKTSSASTTAGEPPKKRKRATPEEIKAREAEKEAEKLRKQEERERKQREKEEAEKAREQQRLARQQEKAKKEQEKAKKEQEMKQRQEEKERKKREKEEEEAKKARSQMKLTAMFGLTAAPKKEPAAPKSDAKPTDAATGEPKKEPSLYENMFKPFFIKEHVRMAKDPCQFDDEAREAKLRILEEHLSGQREGPALRFDPVETLQLPFKQRRRGRVYPSVRKIMADLEGSETTESQTAQMKDALEMLKKVPMKSIKFKEDVRPAYVGTVSGLPAGVQSLARLAKNPASRKILPLNYDYDSEAEWVDEEGEDVEDLDDEEEELDGDEDMDDFLDDSEDVGPARMVFSGGMEPEATGPCWEDRNRRTAEPKLYKHRLEFMLETLEHHHSIDPFSTAYWPSPKSKASASASAPAGPTASSGTAQEAAASAPAPSDAFQALSSGASVAEKGSKKAVQPLPPDMQEKLKGVHHEYPTLTKAGVIELFAAQNPGCSKARIKATFDVVFEMTGKKTFKIRGE
ncbi:hypothetical protein VTJ83DRAFT_5795 [Remersonia thermophila]|uniref:Chromatin assembly factor 1 subunit A dimerization domain-containing protein n=1 Tax=Remersonia thermophila TaxID=72144 RepID=A0ABR4D7Z7_9PEZI